MGEQNLNPGSDTIGQDIAYDVAGRLANRDEAEVEGHFFESEDKSFDVAGRDSGADEPEVEGHFFQVGEPGVAGDVAGRVAGGPEVAGGPQDVAG